MDVVKPALVQGRVRVWSQQGLRRHLIRPWTHNAVMYDWATILSKLMQGLSDYRVNGMYIEFENTAGTADIPEFDRSGGISYYQGLSGDSTRDFLRVPLLAVVVASSNQVLYPAGNAMTFFAQTQGVVGQHGRTFSSAVNSKIVGGALVSMPVQADYTQDLCFSRFYLDADKQVAKSASSQLGLEWELIPE